MHCPLGLHSGEGEANSCEMLRDFFTPATNLYSQWHPYAILAYEEGGVRYALMLPIINLRLLVKKMGYSYVWIQISS